MSTHVVINKITGWNALLLCDILSFATPVVNMLYHIHQPQHCDQHYENIHVHNIIKWQKTCSSPHHWQWVGVAGMYRHVNLEAIVYRTKTLSSPCHSTVVFFFKLPAYVTKCEYQCTLTVVISPMATTMLYLPVSEMTHILSSLIPRLLTPLPVVQVKGYTWHVRISYPQSD